MKESLTKGQIFKCRIQNNMYLFHNNILTGEMKTARIEPSDMNVPRDEYSGLSTPSLKE